jgi:hypothetical protein
MYSLPYITRVMKSRMILAGHVARVGEMRNPYETFVGKPEGKRSLGRPRRGWEDIIIMDLREIVWEVVVWIHLPEVRNQWLFSCEHCNENSGSIKGREFID